MVTAMEGEVRTNATPVACTLILRGVWSLATPYRVVNPACSRLRWQFAVATSGRHAALPITGTESHL